MDRGAYLFNDSEDEHICIFLFCKMSDEEIKKFLPDSYSTSVGDYYIAMYKDNNNYLGRSFYDGITSLMKDEDMLDLNNLKFEDLPERFSDLSKEDFANYLKFVELHVNNFPVNNIPVKN